MAIILDCLHSVGILFYMKHLFSIVRSHLWDLVPILFSCSTSISSLPEALLFFCICCSSVFVVLLYCHSFPVLI